MSLGSKFWFLENDSQWPWQGPPAPQHQLVAGGGRPTWLPEAPSCSLVAGGKEQFLETELAGQTTQKLFSADISPFECLITIPIQE